MHLATTQSIEWCNIIKYLGVYIIIQSARYLSNLPSICLNLWCVHDDDDDDEDDVDGV